MKCYKCQFENPNESSYCMNCGARLDGKIMCPNCRTLVEKDETKCPKCGTKIPHEEKTIKENKLTGFIKRNDYIFQIVFTSVFTLMLFLSLFISVFKMINFPFPLYEDNILLNLLSGSSIYYLSFEFGEYYHPLGIVRFVVSLINLLITYPFAITGIVKGIKQLTKKSNCQFNFYYSTGFVFVTNLLCSYLLLSTYSFSLGEQITISSGFDTYMSLYGLSTILSMIYHIMKKYDSKKKLLLPSMITFSLASLFSMAIIKGISSSFMNINGVQYNFIFSFFNMMNLYNGDVNSIIVPLLSTSFLNLMIFIIILSLSVLHIVFFIKGFYKTSEDNIKHKLPCYVFSIIMFSFSALSLFLSFVQFGLYKYYLFGYTTFDIQTFFNSLFDNSNNVYMGGFSFSILSSSFVILGLSLASFILCKRHIKNQKIIDLQK